MRNQRKKQKCWNNKLQGRRDITHTRDENSVSVIPSKETVPTKSSCSTPTHGAILQDPKQGPSSTTTAAPLAREYIAPKVERSSNPICFRFLQHEVDIHVTTLNFASVEARGDASAEVGTTRSVQRMSILKSVESAMIVLL